MRRKLTAEAREKCFAEEAWLNYFNRYLLSNGVITEKDYKRMTEKIALRYAK